MKNKVVTQDMACPTNPNKKPRAVVTFNADQTEVINNACEVMWQVNGFKLPVGAAIALMAARYIQIVKGECDA